jgi:succinate dehydrogenase flavin-adding protein (antitoxin of CptAB toxin-antitoxin module)
VSELHRIRWHCRRGLLELDLVLGKFLDRCLAALQPSEREAFKRLLEHSDNDLWDLVCGHQQVQDEVERRVLEHLRSL